MAAAKKPTPAEVKAAIKEYHDAATKEAKAEVVKKFPYLSDIFSRGNHS